MYHSVQTNPNRMLGATIYANNDTYGLRPAQAPGPHETVTEVVNAYDLTVRTAEGNVHLGGTYTIYQYAEAVTHATYLQQRTAQRVEAGDVVFLGGAWREVTRVRRQGFSFLWDFADGKNAIRSMDETVTLARVPDALARAIESTEAAAR